MVVVVVVVVVATIRRKKTTDDAVNDHGSLSCNGETTSLIATMKKRATTFTESLPLEEKLTNDDKDKYTDE